MLKTSILHTTVDTVGPRVKCPQMVFGLVNDSSASTILQWAESRYAFDNEDDEYYQATCTNDDGGRQLSGDFFKAGITRITCRVWDAAGNLGQCTFLANVTGL